ncbi:BMP family ABC transporter substrate-binding protein [Paraoerskovia sediminicola]|uniref:BMP family ABC transporter substrate-binding protein n=1 Tax=Paraoerskovia sediminicola TaxID=1138587 RepID=A0ABN6X7Y5_9CELL|nr:BMP family ABC transporter substrate-binding protein [Paraoerskovia sediminicola]BDZ40918.1 BMP family ABC transporter substrate-binding protein [Paraoerskovia sediminicola]
MKRATKVTALAAISALALAACGSAPEESTDAGADGSTDAGADFKACMVSDAGGFDDKSFNESGFNGLTAAEDNLGIETATAESQSNSDFTPNIDNLIAQDCNMIITVGFLLATATGDAATANPDVEFGIVDSTAQDADGNALELDNVKPISFDTAQASYLAGYLAAGMSETGTVATYGGLQIPSVTVFMDGFVDGVAKYNEDKGADVKTLGWDKEGQNGSFAGGFDDQSQGQQLTQTFIDQGADIILPVAGPVGLGSLAAAKDSDGVSVIWVDSDGAETNPDSADLILTSVLKQIGPGVEDVITGAVNDEFDNSPYIGTLENDGVGLAPFHEFEDTVPQELKDEVEQLKQDIIDGTITVESENSPK